MSEWRSIDTAPKDPEGTYFIARRGSFVATCFYKKNHHPNPVREYTLQILTVRDRYAAAEGYFSPTHWRPLGDIPQAERQGGYNG